MGTSTSNTFSSFEKGVVMEKVKDRIRQFIESGIRGEIKFHVEHRKQKVYVKVELDHFVYFDYITVVDRYGNTNEHDTKVLSSWVAGGYADLDYKLARFDLIEKNKSRETAKCETPIALLPCAI